MPLVLAKQSIPKDFPISDQFLYLSSCHGQQQWHREWHALPRGGQSTRRRPLGRGPRATQGGGVSRRHAAGATAH